MAKKVEKVAVSAQEIAETLLKNMGIKGEVSVVQEPETTVVTIETEETGILIGRHGETISAFELLLNQIVNRNATEWQRIVVNTGGYREKQEEMLKQLAENAADRAKETGEPQAIYDLTPSQRRVVHMVLTEDSEVETESQGEGRERHLVVKLKS